MEQSEKEICIVIYLPTEHLREMARTVQDHVGPKAVVLIYHRVVDDIPDPQRMRVSPENFSEQMKALTDMTCPVPVEEILDRLKDRSQDDLPLSAVTFDDGYADNLTFAAPILSGYGIPATVFVAAGAIGQSGEFWWDDLERILLRPDLPDELTLRIGEETRTWSFREDDARLNSGWDVYMNPRLTSQKAYLYIACRMRSLSVEEQQKTIEQLHRWSGIDARARDSFRALTEDQLKQISEGELISIGAHTINHPVLANLSSDSQFFEINTSRQRLEKLLGAEVKTFAYPYGRGIDYCHSTVQCLRKAGFACACTTIPHLIGRWTDALQMSRFSVGNWNGGVFRKNLAEFMLINSQNNTCRGAGNPCNDENSVREGVS
ncbi:polysaccharide deacetylase family protein [Tichowtungia aerotolerans]|uniref:Polysaccharide deacetylase family protein n=1 Tax=Tichowtungia aerotolerans TaxID=2697043 RepID=A0A6P1M8B5_9BACT|nr:polysaccharide deacetylase family protein [Tichowtungia aerotolerans]QHI70282.1 polysaccharide deacetylase family protein [Tichowtungia aerotolerans]